MLSPQARQSLTLPPPSPAQPPSPFTYFPIQYPELHDQDVADVYAYLSPGYNVVNSAKLRNVVVFRVGGGTLSQPAELASLFLQPQQCKQSIPENLEIEKSV